MNNITNGPINYSQGYQPKGSLSGELPPDVGSSIQPPSGDYFQPHTGTPPATFPKPKDSGNNKSFSPPIDYSKGYQPKGSLSGELPPDVGSSI